MDDDDDHDDKKSRAEVAAYRCRDRTDIILDGNRVAGFSFVRFVG